MTCPDAENWDLLAAGVLKREQADPLQAHVVTCPLCRERFDDARRTHVDLMRMYEAFDYRHDEQRDQLMAILPSDPPRRLGAGGLAWVWGRLGDSVMSVSTTNTRRAAAVLAPAACIVIAVVVFSVSGRENAFAAAIEHLRQARTIACSVTTTATVRMQVDPEADLSGIDPSRLKGLPETKSVRNDKLYISADHGVRRDAYENDALVSTSYTSRDGTTLTLHPADRTYQTFEVDEELKEMNTRTLGPDVHFMSLAQNPDRLLRGLRNLSSDVHREVGKATFNGRTLWGYEISGEKVGLGPPLIDQAKENRAELWVNRDSGEVERLVFHFVTSIPSTRQLPLTASFAMTIVYDQFEWDPVLPADWFAASIPDGYTRHADDMPSQVRMPDEESLIEALRAFGEVADRYPESLNTMSVTYEVGYVLGALAAKHRAAERKGTANGKLPDVASLGETLQGLTLYTFLEMKGHEPEYFGAEVEPGDAEKVLMRWRLDDGRLHVIYGDLRVEDLDSPE